MNIFKGKGRGVKGELLPYENLQPLTKQDSLKKFKILIFCEVLSSQRETRPL